VHVANGLARSLTGRTYDTTPLVETLRRYVRNQRLGVDEERNPNEAILSKYEVAFEPLSGAEPDAQRLTRLRSLAFDILGADGAVFGQADKSSFTLSNERLVTADVSDVRSGLFLARLLTSEPKTRTDAASHLRDLLKSEDDAWTTLALPLLEVGAPASEGTGDEAAQRAARSEKLFAAVDGALASPTLRSLRDAFDRLARFEQVTGSKLNSLRRLVLFGCFVIHVHTISRWSELEKGAPRPPILLDFLDGTVVSVRDASRATLRGAQNAIEGLIRMRFREHIRAEWGSKRRAIEANLGASEETERLRPSYENHLAGGADPVEALTRSMVESAFEAGREHPIGALVELGRRAGFLAPWANQGRAGKLQKRYTATAEFLETLIAATVEPDDPLEFPEFLDRLRTEYGIVVGRPEDDQAIRTSNLLGEAFGSVAPINEEDLRANTTRMRQLVVETSYAKAYADGSTIVTTKSI